MKKKSAKRGARASALVRSSTRQVDAAFVLVATAVPLLATILLVPMPLILPTLAVVLIACAAVLAVYARFVFPTNDPNRVTLWDVSGAYALIGIAAGIFSDSERIVEASLR